MFKKNLLKINLRIFFYLMLQYDFEYQIWGCKITNGPIGCWKVSRTRCKEEGQTTTVDIEFK
jgi:hypothetical protein